MDLNFDHQMYLSKCKCWYSNNCLHFLKCAVPFREIVSYGTKKSYNVRERPSDKKILICGSWDSTIKLFSWVKPDKLKPLGALKFHSDSVEAVACTKRPVQGVILKGQLFAAASKDLKVSLWKVYDDS